MENHEDDSMGTSLPNVVPMVEIFAFLLFATMGTSAAQQLELNTRLAKVGTATVADRPRPTVFVQVSRAGKYRVQGQEIGFGDVEKVIRQSVAGTRVLVEPEAEAAWQLVASVLSAAKSAQREAAVRVVEHKEK